MEKDAAKLAKFNEQFQRSVSSPLAEVQTPRVELDGADVLSKYLGSTHLDPTAMSGAEFYAMVGHIKRQHGPKGDSLEAELMKIPRQKDKKIRLADWVSQNISAPATSLPAAGLASPAPQPAMPRLDLSTTMNAEAPPMQQRPATARSANHAMAGGQMSELLGAPSPRVATGSMTARPATAGAEAMGTAAAPPADMSVVFASYCSGRDHSKMSGSEYHSLIAWLRANGHGDLEDILLKVRLLNDKKMQLVRYMKENCAALLPAAAAVPPPTHVQPIVPPLATMPPGSMPPGSMPPSLAASMPMGGVPQAAPVTMGGAQVLAVHHPAAAPPMAAMPPLPPHAAAQMPVAQMPPAAGAPNPAVLQGVATLEATLQRLEESFAFAVECMQTDMAHAKDQLRQLKAQLGGA